MIELDFETKSYSELPKVGAWNYSLHPTTEIICGCYQIDNDPVQSWWPGKELLGDQAWPSFCKIPDMDMPYDLYRQIEDGDTVEAFNAGFEIAICTNVAEIDHGWIKIEADQWRDVMASAAYLSMPQGLDKLCAAIGIEGKDPEGGRLITKYCKLHLKNSRQHIPDHEWVAYKDMTATEKKKNPEAKDNGGFYCDDFMAMVGYCKQDVTQQKEAGDFLGELPETELAIWQMDQRINQRGLYLDEKSLLDAQAIVVKRAEELRLEFRGITSINPGQGAEFHKWLNAQGVEMDNLQADYIKDKIKEFKKEADKSGLPQVVLDHLIPSEVITALEIKSKHGKASTKKIKSMLAQRTPNGRALYQSRYHLTGTGRWGGTGFQPLNLKKNDEDVDPEFLIQAIAHRDPNWLDSLFGDAMDAVGKASRHHIRAEEGSYLMAGDFVSIEAIVLPCLAGEQWKIDAFRRGDPIYELMGCAIHNLGPEAEALARADKGAFKKKYGEPRDDGKKGELAFGFQGNVGAWRKFDKTDRYSDEQVKGFCTTWRKKHSMTVIYWADLQEASMDAVMDESRQAHIVGQIEFQMVDEWLAMRLPNGKRIWYFEPEITMGMPQWHQPWAYDEEDEDTWDFYDCWTGGCSCRPGPQLTYMSMKNGQWLRVSTYGGKLCENSVQATAREILVPAMIRLEKAGYPIILNVYDEIVNELPHGQGSVEEMDRLMCESSGEWMDTWPIRADIWTGNRYRK